MASDFDRHDEKHDRRSGALVAYRWWERIGWLRWLFSRGGEMAGRLFAAGLIASVGTWVAWDAYDARARSKFLMPLISAERLSPATHAYVIQGLDSAGRRADFDLIVADKTFTWERGSTEHLSRNGQQLTAADVQNIILDPLVRARLKSSKQLIAVGTASEEGDPVQEKHRAGQRADQTARWLSAIADELIPLWTLNLGQYQQPCEACDTNETNWQRPFLIIAVRQAAWGIDLAEALADALGSASNLPAPERYSAFALARFR
ncbi:MAG TPA: hypothetical protein P5114_11970 [Hyphomicrobiaceae bacterium]|nr:hypothetical protein [Hyphomicrobiaceae bacterium]